MAEVGTIVKVDNDTWIAKIRKKRLIKTKLLHRLNNRLLTFTNSVGLNVRQIQDNKAKSLN